MLRSLLLAALPVIALEGLPPSDPPGTEARTLVDPSRQEMFIDLAPTDLPAHASHMDLTQPPVATLRIPASGCLFAFRVEVIDSTGRELPSVLLHHFNLIDPDHRELFLPISRRMLAAGRETGAMSIPWLLFGFPVDSGERIVASAMLDNPTDTSYHDARVRLVLELRPRAPPVAAVPRGAVSGRRRLPGGGEVVRPAAWTLPALLHREPRGARQRSWPWEVTRTATSSGSSSRTWYSGEMLCHPIY